MPSGLSQAQVQAYFNSYFTHIQDLDGVNEADVVKSLTIVKYNEGKSFYFNEQ